MIEILDGTKETVLHKENTGIRVYLNYQRENYPPHWHLDTEIIMPLVNIYTIKTGNDTIILEPHDILIIPPTALHEIYAPAYGERIILNVDSVMLNEQTGLAGVLQLLAPYLHITPDKMPHSHQRLVQLLRTIANQYFSTEPLHEVACFTTVLQFFIVFGRELIAMEHRKMEQISYTNYMSRLLEACNFINKHCTENITLEDMAEVAGFSKYHFSRLFKEYMSITCYEYLTKRRIMLAEKLLIHGNSSIMEVAMNSGFGSVSTFNRVFKAEKNCTPTEFIEMSKTAEL